LTTISQGFGGESDPLKVFSAPEIATLTGLALPNVSKILKTLVRGKIIESRRGVQGGYRLIRHPRWITVHEVIEILNGPIALTQCADAAADDCGVESFCPLSSNWRFINDQIRDTLERITLEQMAVPGGVHSVLSSTDVDSDQEERDV